MRAKAITDQDLRFIMRPGFCLRVKYTLNPVQADGSVSISSSGAGKVPSRGGVNHPGASMCGCWPDDERMERPTICEDTFDRCDQSPLDISSSTIQFVLTC